MPTFIIIKQLYIKIYDILLYKRLNHQIYELHRGS